MRVETLSNTAAAAIASLAEGSTDLAIEVGQPLQAEDFDNFLTARFRLYAVHKGRIAFAAIEHHPWPLQHGRIVRSKRI